uniref:PulJ/GspJ family protein n=1 Tax=Deinococcus sp. TaxID=47478 RepID=UPI0025FBF29C
MPNADPRAGFTLVEMLIAMLIAGILLSVLYNLFTNSLDSVGVVKTQNQLLNDTRTAGNFVGDTMNGAVYIYPPNIRLTLAAANPYATQHNGTSNIWTVRTDPFVAGLLPPIRRPTPTSTPPVACDLNVPYNPLSIVSSQGSCYKVVAFYIKSRADYVAAAPTLANPGADNTIPADAQVLMYYSAYVNPGTDAAQPWPTTGFTGRATLLADGLTATGMKFED